MVKNEKEREEIEVISTASASPSEKALLAFGTKLYTDSVSVQIDYGKTMITLISGFFAVYFALLKFLGIENVSIELSQSLPSIWLAPIFFILSIIVLVVGVVLPFPQSISLDVLSDIRSARKQLMWVKYGSSIAATIIFLIGLALTLQISVALLS